MSGSKILFDTNALIRFLQGDKNLINILEGADRYISFITEIELFCKPGLTDQEHSIITELVAACTVIPYTEEMKSDIIRMRTAYCLKMPDAFIAATAIYFKLPILTFDAAFLHVESLDILYPQ